MYKNIRQNTDLENLEHCQVLVIVHYKAIKIGNNLIQISSFKFNLRGYYKLIIEISEELLPCIPERFWGAKSYERVMAYYFTLCFLQNPVFF